MLQIGAFILAVTLDANSRFSLVCLPGERRGSHRSHGLNQLYGEQLSYTILSLILHIYCPLKGVSPLRYHVKRVTLIYVEMKSWKNKT